MRREIVVRAATAADAPACTLLDGAYTTTHIWQLDTRQDSEEVRVSFRQLRLPRELTLIAPHRPPTLPAGGQRRGLLWLVAEEVEVGGPSSPSNRASQAAPIPQHELRAALDAVPPWSHAVRSGRGASSVQLSLPPAPAGQRPPGSMPSQVVGYVSVACAPRDENAYLRALVVDRAHRRKGVGGRLIAEAKRWAGAQGAARLIADAPARNYPALRLLQKTGFAFCGFNDCCYSDHEVAVFFSARL